MNEQEAVAMVAVAEKKLENENTLRILDELRRTRKARGGTGAPLEVPTNLKNQIVITDADLT